MFAVIRTGGKQYRVAPGDVIRIEKQAAEKGTLEFTDVLAVSAEEGKIGRPQGEGARVSGQVLEEGRGDKILVFHYKRKKQYKKLQGHRQPFTQVRITEIAFDGQKFTAPEIETPVKEPKPKKAKPAAKEGEAKHAAPAHKKAAHKKAAAKKGKAKSTSKKKK
ncbi:MAG TPA: 50S ribosomal protein L21 [Terriglobales bacterium]|jgi:large subunit ribosomal protein L21|nr:50S ribosomal protein L21 [Terriglobales bacterium]